MKAGAHTARLLILAPLAIEARALRRGVAVHRRTGEGRQDGIRVVRTGMGPNASRRAAERLSAVAYDDMSVVVAGFCGGLRRDIHTGDVVVANEVRAEGETVDVPAGDALAEVLRSAGLTVHLGPVLSSEQLAFGARRGQFAAGGCLGADMESYWLLRGHRGPVAVVRAVSDTAGERFLGGMLPFGWLRAYRSLVRIATALLTA